MDLASNFTRMYGMVYSWAWECNGTFAKRIIKQIAVTAWGCCALIKAYKEGNGSSLSGPILQQ